jgi:hypothetical protein
VLGHSQPSTTARYAHLAASPLHTAVDAIGAKIAAAMTPRDESEGQTFESFQARHQNQTLTENHRLSSRK